MFVNSEIESELVILRTVYDTESEISVCYKSDCIEIVFEAVPRQGCEANHTFVAAKLLFRVTNDFPSIAPSIEILNVRGIGEKRLRVLSEALEACIEDSCGEPCLFALCEATRDVLDSLNTPEGNCCFCLETLMNSQDDDLSEADSFQHLHLLPCSHTFHKHCFIPWWHHQQKHMKEKEKELITKTGAGAQRITLPRKHHDAYILYCPICREDITIDDVNEDNSLQKYECWNALTSLSLHEVLSSAEIEKVKANQEKWKGRFHSQMEKGGILKETPFVLTLSSSISVNDDSIGTDDYIHRQY